MGRDAEKAPQVIRPVTGLETSRQKCVHRPQSTYQFLDHSSECPTVSRTLQEVETSIPSCADCTLPMSERFSSSSSWFVSRRPPTSWARWTPRGIAYVFPRTAVPNRTTYAYGNQIFKDYKATTENPQSKSIIDYCVSIHKHKYLL